MYGLARTPGESDAHSNMITTSLNNFLPPTEDHSPESAHSSLSSNLDIHGEEICDHVNCHRAKLSFLR